MSAFRLSPEAEADLDGIWLHIARESGSVELASRVVEDITERFWLLAKYLLSISELRIEDCGTAAPFPLGARHIPYTFSRE